ncbi:helix-turn-helix domain-containing protein [Noviherbaspirillum saxi]|uniref:Helix-turn-helix domain-containing protein n=1 Tax=Noviherbaspirillum saxi TaxID=2320863 RepID=A0A3A3FGW3_9BURK|nr:helix-turn-helix domain-containing protein [Noviherbaspirillum saxi]RJF92410.1 helix-turn-helix domain-containing protein [Noviherbaspirillum saxi]
MATKRTRRDFTALEQRRRQAARLLAKGITQTEVARELGVSRQSVSVWAKAQETDRQGWRRKPLGLSSGIGLGATQAAISALAARCPGQRL